MSETWGTSSGGPVAASVHRHSGTRQMKRIGWKVIGSSVISSNSAPEHAVELLGRPGPVDRGHRQHDPLGVEGGQRVGDRGEPAGVLRAVDVAPLVHVEHARPALLQGSRGGAIALHLLDQLGRVQVGDLCLHGGQDVRPR